MSESSSMSAEEYADLLALGHAISGTEHSQWQPRCIARAFATPDRLTVALTMQGWIDLDTVESPLLDGECPREDRDIKAAFRAFGLGWDGLDADDVARVLIEMREAVTAAFSLALSMRDPSAEKESESGGSDGFGTWLPIFGFLVKECVFCKAEALATRVDHAYALIAAVRRNEGWKPVGTTYALRDLEASEEGITNPIAS